MNRGPINLPFLLLSCKYFIKKVSKELVLFAFGKTFIFWEKTLDWKISTIPGIRNIFLQSKAMKYKAGICYCRKIGLKIYVNEEFQGGQKLKITFSIYFATNKIYIISKIIFFQRYERFSFQSCFSWRTGSTSCFCFNSLPFWRCRRLFRLGNWNSWNSHWILQWTWS